MVKNVYNSIVILKHVVLVIHMLTQNGKLLSESLSFGDEKVINITTLVWY